MDTLIRNLKQRVPKAYISIPDDIQTISNQELFLEQLSSDLEQNPYFFKSVFKQILSKQEKEDFEILEDFYSIYLDRLISSSELSAFDTETLTYQVSPEIQVQIQENPRLISGLNTTGLRTWELSVYLAYFLINEYLPRHNFQHKNILELGTGTGLVGLSLLKFQAHTDSLLITDGDSQLVEKLSKNLQLNGINMEDPEKIRCVQYIWGRNQDPLPIAEDQAIDLCVGADITYDVSILDSLVHTLLDLFEKCQLKTLLIACTIRNIETINRFVELLQENHLHYNALDIIPVQTMFLNPTSQFKVFEISRV